MQVTLMGGELGHWFLTDYEGNSFPLVERHEGHLNATLLGWDRPLGIEDDEAIIDALEWLMDHNGEDFVAPKSVSEYFEELYADQE